MNFFIFFLCLFALSFSSFADDCAYSKSEVDMYTCFSRELSNKDRELNNLYQDLMVRYKKDGPWPLSNIPSRDVYLKKVQLIWIKYRDTSCNYETYESNGGTGFSTIYEKCLLDKTIERIKYLKELN